MTAGKHWMCPAMQFSRRTAVGRKSAQMTVSNKAALFFCSVVSLLGLVTSGCDQILGDTPPEIPLPESAADTYERTGLLRSSRVYQYSLAEPYPSLAVFDYYDMWGTNHGWIRLSRAIDEEVSTEWNSIVEEQDDRKRIRDTFVARWISHDKKWSAMVVASHYRDSDQAPRGDQQVLVMITPWYGPSGE